jgi:tryptophanyl-tRNA synthetase
MTTAGKITLTGIKPTGTPHIGNYVGAIKPALELANGAKRALYFIADYHALTMVHDKAELDRLIYEVAATWLASGLDPDKVLFYRQSDVPEVFELSWVLSCLTPKGLMNRAHAYKAAVQANEEKGVDVDAGVNMGLYCYPVLMAADIIAFDAEVVPVGKDQVQHVEIARDIAQYFNNTFGEALVLPGYKIEEATAAIPGLDGRKMSKSYDNTVPLFAPKDKLRKLLMRFVTDSSAPDAPKDPKTSPLFALYAEFASPEQTETMQRRFAEGIMWGHVKQELFEVLDAAIAPKRARYEELMTSRDEVDRLLAAGADRARPIAQATLDRVRRAVGARR